MRCDACNQSLHCGLCPGCCKMPPQPDPDETPTKITPRPKEKPSDD